METIFDWVSVLAFSGLIVLFLNRSAMDNPPDRLFHYLPPAVGFAVVNYLGNDGHEVAAWLIFVSILVYIWLILKPFKKS
ncbi:hypothetical protein LWE61_18455 [Sphingobium sufflavum]|uniref:XrtV sorting system accessory protein n=1 Tax=Sphingobium sufflavum TaxID=1129547 RepID=UPI001F2BC622|nr:XrtV sorting system accessory protein [Sphingobium sufflavum]MCE7798517.1 hypothetical protein [Sphingobium sufflavum]